MAEMLLINPRKRHARKAHHTAKRRVHHTRRKANPYAAMLTHARRRKHTARKHNPIHAMRRRVMRRRNPIGGGMMSGYMTLIKDGLIGGAGAVAMDVVYGYVNNMLPASLQNQPNTVTSGDAVKAMFTVAAGKGLSRMTGGLSMKAAQASLAIQSYNIVKQFLPATMSLGYASPAQVITGTNRVGPIRQGMNAYVRPGQTPLLSAYQRPGATALLNGKAAKREGVSMFY
jgi:hypothetical protein